MRLEFARGSLHASHVRDAFVRELRNSLPEQAFAELDALPMQVEAIERWAEGYGINASCVVSAFASFCDGGWTRYRSMESEVFEGPQIPTEWRQSIDEWNARPIDPQAWRGFEADEYVMHELRMGRSLRGLSQDAVDAAIDRHLGPIATDPARESWDDFLLRAQHHWTARRHLAEAAGFRPS